MDEFSTYGLFGEQVSGSPAPQIYNAFFDELGVHAVYIPFPVKKGRFLAALPVLRTEFAGFDIAVPYRLDIAPHLDSLDENAKTIGAVNTVKVQGGKLTGYNTDSVGFDRSLVGFMGNLYDTDVLLIGAGGAAYAAANVLLAKGVFLTIISANDAQANALKSKLQSKFNRNRVKVLKEMSSSDTFYTAVNATGVDIEGKESEISVNDNTYKSLRHAYDMHIGNTAFLTKAGEAGADIKDGFDMFFYKTVETLKIWLGIDIPDVSIISKVYENIKSNMGISKQ